MGHQRRPLTGGPRRGRCGWDIRWTVRRGKQQEQQQQRPDEEQKMSKEDAERVLDALKNDEKDLQKERKVKTSGRAKVLKDW